MCLETTSCSKRVWKVKMSLRKKDPLQLESVSKVKKIDLIDVDNFHCVLPPRFMDLVNNL